MKEESSFILQRFRRKKTQAFASIFLFSSSLSLAQCPYFHNYFHNFLAYFALRNGKKRNGRKRKILIHAAGRASSTFPLKRPLNHNLFGPSFHCISLKMIYALFVAENFRSEIASERVLANPASKTEALKTEYASKFPPRILEFFYLRPISLEFPLKTETRAELSNFSQICFRFTMKQKKKKNNKNKNKRNIYT